MTEPDTQWTADDLRGKSDTEIETARQAGLLTDLIGATQTKQIIDAIRNDAQWTRADLKGKTPEQINAARLAGKLDTLMNGEVA